MVSSQSEDELVSLLQSLADMDITYKALQVKNTTPFCGPFSFPRFAFSSALHKMRLVVACWSSWAKRVKSLCF